MLRVPELLSVTLQTSKFCMVKVPPACALGVLDSEMEGFFHVSAG